jgi:hypothetical protein
MRARAAVPACPAQHAIPVTTIPRHVCRPAITMMTMPRVTDWSREFDGAITLRGPVVPG